MLFNSFIFIFFFLPISLLLYYVTLPQLRNVILLGISLIFYAWGELQGVVLLLSSIVVTYITSLLIEYFREKPKRARLAVFIGIAFNLGLLCFFKYAAFAIASLLNPALTYLDYPTIQLGVIALPIGISFFTFQSVSYLIDVYRGTIKAEKNFINLGLYSAIFPHLVAGPIIRYRELADQLIHRQYTRKGFTYGIQRFSTGLAKKVLIANNMGVIVDNIFALDGKALGTDLAWLGIICYTIQIFFDFSGYSDMAIGLGYMFGFTLPENFNYPYFASSIREFWQRWHITLSNWLRDYVFFPLSRALLKRYGSRFSTLILFVSHMTTMIICGLWHGLGAGFVIWGIWHGLGLFANSQVPGLRRRYNLPNLPRPISILLTVALVMIGWVFFRAETLPQALSYLATMFSLRASDPAYSVALFLSNEKLLALLMGVLFSMPIVRLVKDWTQKSVDARSPVLRAAYDSMLLICRLFVYSGLFVLSMMALISGTYTPFIYFRF